MDREEEILRSIKKRCRYCHGTKLEVVCVRTINNENPLSTFFESFSHDFCVVKCKGCKATGPEGESPEEAVKFWDSQPSEFEKSEFKKGDFVYVSWLNCGVIRQEVLEVNGRMLSLGTASGGKKASYDEYAFETFKEASEYHSARLELNHKE